VIAGAALWFAAERHYESCIREAEATHPITTEEAEPSVLEEYEQYPEEPQPTTQVVGEEERQAAVDECSRWPF
jgi:hypothetical protein